MLRILSLLKPDPESPIKVNISLDPDLGPESYDLFVEQTRDIFPFIQPQITLDLDELGEASPRSVK